MKHVLIVVLLLLGFAKTTQAAINFDGTDDYVDAGTGSSLGITSTLTISLWIKPDTFGDSSFGRLVDKNLIGDIGNKYHVKIMAFEYDKRKDNVYQIKIVCPFLRKINKLKQLTKKI